MRDFDHGTLMRPSTCKIEWPWLKNRILAEPYPNAPVCGSHQFHRHVLPPYFSEKIQNFLLDGMFFLPHFVDTHPAYSSKNVRIYGLQVEYLHFGENEWA